MYISLSKVNMTIFEPKGRYRAITVEVYIFFKKRRKAVVWLYAKESAIDVFWNLMVAENKPGYALALLDLRCR